MAKTKRKAAKKSTAKRSVQAKSAVGAHGYAKTTRKKVAKSIAKKRVSPTEIPKAGHVTRGNVLDDLALGAEAAIAKIKSDIHLEILQVVEKRRLSSRDLERILDQPQPRISELLNGKISKMTIDKLVGYLTDLGCKVSIYSQMSRSGAA